MKNPFARKQEEIELDKLLEGVTLAKDIKYQQECSKQEGHWLSTHTTPLMDLYNKCKGGQYKEVLQITDEFTKHPGYAKLILVCTDYFNQDSLMVYSDLCLIGGRIAKALGKRRKVKEFYQRGYDVLEEKAQGLAVGWIGSGGSTRWGEELSKRIAEQVEIYGERQRLLKELQAELF